ncbi:Mdm33 family-domain-containing protein [Fennellomyces sp. T-0311]|nr:Mdm33 family-domain-containing protein [Fennellomyces sp. T-0311]
MALRLKSTAPLGAFLFRPRNASNVKLYMVVARRYTQDNKPRNDELTTTANEYLTKLQATIKPRLTPVLTKMQMARDTLRNIRNEVNDPKEAIQKAGVALNQLTGYDQIDQVKRRVTDQAKAFEISRDQVQSAKRIFEEAIDTRSSTQREINELLQRKHMWTGEDVTRFTELYRLEHDHSRAELTAKEQYQHCEKQMDREYMALAQSIMERYHEEQLWSDKIRSVSTYGTWALMVLNLLLFFAVQTIFEPMKRKRLTDRFEDLLVAKVAEEELKFKELMDEREITLNEQQKSILAAVEDLAASVSTGQQYIESRFDAEERRAKEEVAAPPPAPEIIPAVDPVPTVTLGESDIVLSKKTLALYSIESAIAGGLVTALAVFFWQ